MSQEYIGSIAIVVVAILHAFGINVGNDVISSLIIGIIGLYVAFRRYQRGDITIAGAKL